MKKTSETVIFFGSGPVAAESLRLLEQNFTVEAVITKPRAENHKGSVPVIEIAEKLNLPIYTVSDKQSLDDIFSEATFSSHLGVLIDFGIIVSQKTIDYFPLGIVNSHFSLLPEWRGADPITFSILSGQKTTGVSLMLLVEAMDEGPLLGQADYDLPASITTPLLTQDLVELSDWSLKTILPLYLSNEVFAEPQEAVTIAPSKTPTYSRKLTKADGIIDWQKPAAQIEREIRAFIEWPKSHAQLGGISVIITEARVVDQSGEPGTITVKDKEIFVSCGDKSLSITKLKPTGKQEMSASAFLAGYGKSLPL